MDLCEYVCSGNMDAVITMMLCSMIMLQKFSFHQSHQQSFAQFLSSGEDKAHLLLHILQDMIRNEAMYQTIRQRQHDGKEKRDV
eukprot:9396976-Ditylum_brightwellii.AAC.1